MEPKIGGRRPNDPRDRRIEVLEREKSGQEKRLPIAEESLELQKRFFALVEDAKSENSQ